MAYTYEFGFYSIRIVVAASSLRVYRVLGYSKPFLKPLGAGRTRFRGGLLMIKPDKTYRRLLQDS